MNRMLALLTKSEGYNLKSFLWIDFLYPMQEKLVILNILSISMPTFNQSTEGKSYKPFNIWKQVLEQQFSNLYSLQVQAFYLFKMHFNRRFTNS